MTPKTKMTPAQVADALEKLAQQEIDEGDREAAALYMRPCHAIRHLMRTLRRLNQRIHSGYDFNADPDKITLEVGALLEGQDAILDGDRIDWLEENWASLVAIKEVWDDEDTLWWQVQKRDESLSGHPETQIRAAIDAAMKNKPTVSEKP